jgi:hypothetical protein
MERVRKKMKRGVGRGVVRKEGVKVVGEIHGRPYQ